MENKKLILDKENIKYMLEKTLNFSSKKKQRSENSSCINDNTISKEKTWSSEKISDFTLKNIDTTWTEIKDTNPSVNFTKEGHMKEVEIFGNTWQDTEGNNLINLSDAKQGIFNNSTGDYEEASEIENVIDKFIVVEDVENFYFHVNKQTEQGKGTYCLVLYCYDTNKKYLGENSRVLISSEKATITNFTKIEFSNKDTKYIKIRFPYRNLPIFKENELYIGKMADLSDIRHVGELQEDGRYKIEVESSDVGLGRELVVSDVLGTHHSATWQTFQMDFSIIDKIKNILGDEVRHGMAKKQYDYYLVDDNTKGWIAIVKNGESFPTKKDIITELNKKIKSSKQTLLLPCQLMKVGDVQDRLYWNGEKYVIEKNTNKVVLNGEENWLAHGFGAVWLYEGNIPNIKHPEYGDDLSCWMNNKFPNKRVGTSLDEAPFVGISTNKYREIFIVVEGYTQNSESVALTKEYLKENPMDFYYQLETPQLIETDITEQIFIPTYKDKTHFFVKGGLDGEIKGKVPVDAGKAIRTLSNENRELSALNEKAIETNKTQDYLINVNMLATDELYTIVEPLMENSLLNAQENSSSKIIILYVAMVKRNLKTIEEIPEKYKEEVLSILSN